MYETGSGLKPYLPKGETPYPEEGIPTLQPFPPHVSKTCSLLFCHFLSTALFPRLSLMSSPCLQTFLSAFLKKQKQTKNVFLPHLPLSSFFAASKTVIKKHNLMRWDATSHISSCPDTFLKPLSCICLLFTGVLLVCQTNVVVHLRRCCYSDILRRFVLCFMLMKH